MTLNEFILLHPEFSTSTLVKVIELIGITELLDLYKNIDQDHFTYIANLYTSIWRELFKDPLPSITDGINRLINEPLFYIIMLTRFMSYHNIDKPNPAYRNMTRDDLDILNSPLVLLFHLGQLLLYCSNIFYPGELFYNELSKAFINHVMINILDNKEPEFLLILHELLIKYSL